MPMKSSGIKLTDEQRGRLEKMSQQSKVLTVGDLVRHAIDMLFEEVDKTGQLAFKLQASKEVCSPVKKKERRITRPDFSAYDPTLFDELAGLKDDPSRKVLPCEMGVFKPLEDKDLLMMIQERNDYWRARWATISAPERQTLEACAKVIFAEAGQDLIKSFEDGGKKGCLSKTIAG